MTYLELRLSRFVHSKNLEMMLSALSLFSTNFAQQDASHKMKKRINKNLPI